MKVFSHFFLLCDNGRDMQSASIQEVLVQCNGTSHRPPTASKNNIGLSAETAKSAGRRRPAHSPHNCARPLQWWRWSTAAPRQCTAPQARACEAVLRLLPNESESGIVAQ